MIAMGNHTGGLISRSANQKSKREPRWNLRLSWTPDASTSCSSRDSRTRKFCEPQSWSATSKGEKFSCRNSKVTRSGNTVVAAEESTAWECIWLWEVYKSRIFTTVSEIETLFRLISTKCVYPEKKLVVELSCVKFSLGSWRSTITWVRKVSY